MSYEKKIHTFDDLVLELDRIKVKREKQGEIIVKCTYHYMCECAGATIMAKSMQIDTLNKRIKDLEAVIEDMKCST